MKLKSGEAIYVMEKTVTNRDFPDPSEGSFGKIKPYHDGCYIVVIGTEKGNPRIIREFGDEHLDDLIEFLKPFSGKFPIKGERHWFYPEEIDMHGDVEMHRGIIWRDYNQLREEGITIEGFD